MPRHVKIGLIVLGLGLAIAVGFFVDVVGRVQLLMKNDKETEENPFKAPPQPLYAPTDPPLAVKVFFPETSGDVLLTTEDQTIFKSTELANRARQILQKLQEGPHSEALSPALPKDTKVDDLFISGQGTAFIDFSNAISTNHPGGVLNEMATNLFHRRLAYVQSTGNQAGQNPGRGSRKRNPGRPLPTAAAARNGSLDDECHAARRKDRHFKMNRT